MRYAMNVANGNQTSVVDLFSDHVKCLDQCLPGGIDVRCLGQQRKPSSEGGRQSLRVDRYQAKTIDGNRSSRRAAKLHQVLWSDVQHFTAPVQFGHGLRCGCELRIRAVRKPTKNAGIDQVGH